MQINENKNLKNIITGSIPEMDAAVVIYSCDRNVISCKGFSGFEPEI